MGQNAYSGTRVERSDVPREEIDHNNLTSAFVQRLETHGEEKKLSDIEKRRLEELLHEETLPRKSSLAGNIVGALVGLIVVAVPLVITYLNQKLMMGIIWTIIVTAATVFFMVYEKRKRDSYAGKIELTKNNRYRVFTLTVERKLWYKYSMGRHEKKRTYYCFYLQCNGMTLSVDPVTYEEITDQAVIAVFFSDEGASMDIFASKDIFPAQ